MPDDVAVSNAFEAIDVPDEKIKQLKQEIVASGLLGAGNVLAETLQKIVDQPDPVLYQVKTHGIFTQLRDDAGAEVLIIEGDVTADVEGQQVVTDIGQRLTVVSAEYHVDKDWTFIRFPAFPIAPVKSISINLPIK